MRNKTIIDQPAFERLLSWLNSDPEKAAQKYESIRHRLVEIFSSRQFVDAEHLADDTIDRVIKKVPQIEENWEGDPRYYFIGVAKKVILEASKPKPPVNPPPSSPDPEELELEDQCLEQCLAMLLKPDERKLLLEYMGGNIQQRKEQAERLGISLNALRIRAFQAKKTVSPCVKDCVRKHEPEKSYSHSTHSL